MTFQRAKPGPHYRDLRLLSASGRWELGLSSYHSGYRLRMGLAGRPPSLLDFCLGSDSRLFGPVLLAVLARLDGAPESAEQEELDALFPWAGSRPDLAVHLDELLGSNEPSGQRESAPMSCRQCAEQ